MKLDIAVLSGDGIGPEVIAQAIKTLEAISHSFDHTITFKHSLIGAAAMRKHGNSLPQETLELCVNTDAILFGAVGDPVFDCDPDMEQRPEQRLLQLRKKLGLYANIRPFFAYDALLNRSPLKIEVVEGTDFIIFRELKGGLYFKEKKLNKKGTTASDLCEYSEDEIVRISHLAFKAALKRKKTVTLVDKASVLESSRLWRRVVSDIHKEYPEVQLTFMYVDTAAKQLILNPSQFDVILTENMFGDILSDEASAIGGYTGLIASASIGENCCLFEPAHGTYPKALKKGIANPIASILCAAMLLDHFGLVGEATAVRDAVKKALELRLTTPDLNPINPLTTEKVGDFIYDYILNPEDSDMNFENIYVGQSTII